MKHCFKLILIVLFFGGSLLAQSKIAPPLMRAIDQAAATNGPVDALIMLKDRVDIRALDRQLYEENTSLQERAYTVITTLQEKANATQPELLAYLEANKQSGRVMSYESLWITNMVVVRAEAAAILEISDRLDVDYLQINSILERDKPVEAVNGLESVPNGSEPGLLAINAHLMWEAGFTGDGVIVMNMDTGVNGNHPALAARWQGAQAGVSASEAWFDPASGSTFPNDGDASANHGTHTMGTIAGLDPNTADTIGVAFGSTWIASNSLIGGSPHTSRSIASFQWAMDPDGNPGTTDDMPVGIGNSWFDPNITTQCDAALNPYIDVISAVEAAGIGVIFSAGNSGPGATSITSPKNVNLDIVNFWATGAVDGNNASLPIASFSSRGPVVSECITGDNSLDIKPEASAPGVSVRSSQFASSYGNLSGTSMACPHIVGALALLREAFPNKTGTELKTALYFTARDLGAAGEDNDYGMGIIDVWAAYQALLGGDNPAITVNPGSIDFGTLLVGNSDTSTVTIRNVGGASLSVTGITASGAPFSVINAPSLPASVPQFSAVTFDVVYDPAAENSDVGTVTIASNDPDDPSIVVNLSGSAIANLDAWIWNPTNLIIPSKAHENSKKTGRGSSTYYETQKQAESQIESGNEIAAALTANGKSSIIVSEFPSQLNGVDYLFIILGHWDTNRVITAGSAEATAIENFIAGGGHVYLEGGDVWFWDPGNRGGHDFGPTFGINALSDGASGGELTTIVGADFLAGQDFAYIEGNDNFPDHLEPAGTGFTIHSNTLPAFVCGIANAGVAKNTAGRTIGVSQQFKDLIDGTSPSTRNELMGSYLQFFDGDGSAFNMTLAQGWNLMSLPGQVADGSYLEHFPNATAEPFLYNGGYSATATMTHCVGYWLHMPAQESVEVDASAVTDCEINLAAGWNMIGVPSCNVAVSSIDDPGGIINGDIFGYSGGYFSAATLTLGGGYWVNATTAGTITLICDVGPAPKAAVSRTEGLIDLTLQNAIAVRDAGNNEQILYFDVAAEDVDIENVYSLPPVPPAGIFDARFSTGTRLISGDAGTIRLQASVYPVMISVEQLSESIAEGYQIEVLKGRDVVAQHPLKASSYIEISDPAVKELRLSKMTAVAPEAFVLEQNYPNPFNPVTLIRFAVPETGEISLKVFNTRGQLVRKLAEGNFEPGFHQVYWDATGTDGKAVSSGVFFYQLTGKGFTEIKKMVLLK